MTTCKTCLHCAALPVRASSSAGESVQKGLCRVPSYLRTFGAVVSLSFHCELHESKADPEQLPLSFPE